MMDPSNKNNINENEQCHHQQLVPHDQSGYDGLVVSGFT